MGSIGSINKPSKGFLVAAIQMPVPIINSRADIDKQVKEIVRTLHATKAGYPGAELIIFPEYSTQGLNTSKWLTEEFLCDIPGAETEAFAKACKEEKVFGVFSIMERNPDPTKNPYNTAIIINPDGEICLKYRKLFPWNPVEPWYPGDLGMPVCEGPGGSKLAVCICHDGMIPELAREAAYKGCNVYIRISGYSTQVNDQWILTNRSNAWQNLMYTVSVNLAGMTEFSITLAKDRLQTTTELFLSRDSEIRMKSLLVKFIQNLQIRPERNGALKIIFIISVIVVMLQSQAENLTVA